MVDTTLSKTITMEINQYNPITITLEKHGARVVARMKVIDYEGKDDLIVSSMCSNALNAVKELASLAKDLDKVDIWQHNLSIVHQIPEEDEQ